MIFLNVNKTNMSCVLYKNLLVIDRGSPYIDHIKNLNPTIIFESNYVPFRYTSPNDKLVLIFENSLTFNDSCRVVAMSFELDMLKYKQCVGIIKIYCDTSHLKVYSSEFKYPLQTKNYFILLKEFIIKSVYAIVKNEYEIDASNYFLHWEVGMINSVNAPILKELDMLGEGQYYSYKFTSDNIKRFSAWLGSNVYNKPLSVNTNIGMELN